MTLILRRERFFTDNFFGCRRAPTLRGCKAQRRTETLPEPARIREAASRERHSRLFPILYRAPEEMIFHAALRRPTRLRDARATERFLSAFARPDGVAMSVREPRVIEPTPSISKPRRRTISPMQSLQNDANGRPSAFAQDSIAGIQSSGNRTFTRRHFMQKK